MMGWLKKLWEKGAPKPPPPLPAPDELPRDPSDTPGRAGAARPAGATSAERVTPIRRPSDRGRARDHAPGRSQGSSFDWRSYDVVAEDYERVQAPYTAEPVKDLLALAGAREGTRALDVGTGTALAVEITAGAVGSTGIAVGIDPAVRMLEIAHRSRPTQHLAAAEVLDLPFADGAFDVVVANFALPYFRKLDTALFEIMRVLKPGGRIAVSVYSSHEDDLTRTWRELVEETIGPDVLRAGVKEEIPWAAKLGDAKRLEAALRDDGFRPVKVERRKYRFQIPRDDYIIGHEIEAVGRFVRRMLGPELWERFRERVRARYAERFPEQLLDFRDVLLAVGTKPS